MEKTASEDIKQDEEENSDEDSLMEDQLLRVSPDVDKSPNDGSSEDLSIVPSANCSPQLTPNTTFVWGAAHIEGSDSMLESGNVPIEDTLKKNKLEGLTHDFLHANLEKESQESNVSEENQQEDDYQPEGR